MIGSHLVAKLREDVKTWTHNEKNKRLVKIFNTLETKTSQPRERFVYVVLFLIAVYLLIGHSAELVCNLIAFAFPAYQSMLAIRSENKKDDTQWLMYWTVFALASLLDFVSEKILGWFPIYWLIKCVFLLWLSLPITRGAEILYKSYVSPLMDRYESLIKETGSELKNEAKGAVSDATLPSSKVKKTK